MKFASPRKIVISHWLYHHRDSLNKTITRLSHRPIAFLSTVMLIAVAFAIPLALFTLAHAIEDITTGWDNDKQITLFLHQDINLDSANQLAADLQQQFAIEAANAMDKDQVLADFSQQTQYTLMAKTWQDQNPLPHIIKIQPAEQANLEHLAGLFATHPDVAQVQFDWCRVMPDQFEDNTSDSQAKEGLNQSVSILESRMQSITGDFTAN